MKVLTLIGTRPEIIRLSRIIPKLDKYAEQILVHTGQNYDDNLNKIFMDQLGVRKPDYYLDARGSFGEQLGVIVSELEKIIDKEKPDAMLVLGDTNSSLGALAAKRKGVRVFHMEAGNRCHDDRVPEEVNRRIIDHSSDILLPYTERSRDNLIREGIPHERIYVTGNPIGEVLRHYEQQIRSSPALYNYDLIKKNYFLVTLHRAENVDDPVRLTKFVEVLNTLPELYDMPVIWAIHPRTRKQLNHIIRSEVKLLDPLGLFDFVGLERYAYCVLSDSGTVQEECALLETPCVTLRDATERPETLESGTNFLSGAEPTRILKGIELATNLDSGKPPTEYLTEHVSDKVLKIVLGYYQ